jgi:nucleoid DNA-binding protein
MKKQDLTLELARQAQLSPEAAADRIDQVVHRILTSLRHGKSASLPGLGTFTPGAKTGFRFDVAKADRRAGK